MNSPLQPLSVGGSAFGDEWFRIEDEDAVRSPALVVYRERVEKNLLRMLAIVGDPSRLRPHIKTHKMAALVERQLALGITKFKCATLREAELAASCGALDVLVAYQLVGPNVRWFRELSRAFPATHFSALVDDLRAARELADTARPIELLLDLDLGQHRTGVEPDAQAARLYRHLASTPGINVGGLHAYDGHVVEHDPVARAAACEEAFAPVATLRAQLLATGLSVPRIVAGGTPTFPMHALCEFVECSPGTCVFWDAGYASKFGDLGFEPAALVLTRVVSRPGANQLCLDLGHKAVAAEMPHPRVIFPQLPDAVAISHSEEHLVVETARAPEFPVGAALYGIPWHICPTVALHAEALVIEHGRVVATWPVGARGRRLEMVVPPVPK
jgi:D-serine deaminase-like pyridoxal phosphate-dependent protein